MGKMAFHGKMLWNTTKCHFMPFHAISCYFKAFHVILHHITAYHGIFLHFMPFHAITKHFMSFHIILHHFTSFHTISWHIMAFLCISCHFKTSSIFELKTVICLKKIPRKIIIRFWKNLGHFSKKKMKKQFFFRIINKILNSSIV